MPVVDHGKKKKLNSRYIRWCFWSLVFRLLPFLKSSLHFSDELIAPSDVPHDEIKDVLNRYDLKALGQDFTDNEREFLSRGNDRDKVTDAITYRHIVRVMKNVCVNGRTGMVLYQNKALSSYNTSLNHNLSKPSWGRKKILKEDNGLWLPLLGIHKGHKHFGHFFLDYLAELFYAIEALPTDQPITVVTREDRASFQQYIYDYIAKEYPHISFVTMPDNEIWELPRAVHVERQCNVSQIFLDQEYIDFLRVAYRDAQGIVPAESTKGHRYYISRGDIPKRGVANEAELLPILEEHGFKVIYPTHLSLKDQIELYSNAEAIIAPAGSAMLNLLYVRPETKVRILYPANQLAGDFLWLSKSLGIKDDRHIIAGDCEGKRGEYSINKSDIIHALDGFK